MQQQLILAKSWEERYRMIIQAGKNLPQPNETELATMQPISGCEAKVWFKFEQIHQENADKNSAKTDRTFHFQAYSDARIINGLLWILLQEINGKTATELRSFNLTQYFTRLGIAQRLSASRLNGLKQIEKLINTLV
ncbi:MAG TPA: hypothetical protein DD638_07220 [Pasteurellaceae bacterium]|nr:hypothetical protein [Pasteurellaceae bacterium]